MPRISIQCVQRMLLSLLMICSSMPIEAFAKKPSNSKWLSAAPTPLPFMTFDEIANLEHTQRLKYVRYLRQSVREIEKINLRYGYTNSKKKNARLENSENWNHLYAFIMGEPAEAQSEPIGTSGNRGRKPGDKCIYGYNLSRYPTDGKRQPFECLIPNEQRCAGGGVKCGGFLSGLNTSVANGRECIPHASRRHATAICDDKRSTLTNENSAKIISAFDNANQFFKIGQNPPGTLTGEQLKGAEARKILQDLSYHAYDDRAYAMLIYLMGLYKKNRITPPVAGEKVTEIQKNLLNPEYFETNLIDVQSAINQVFSDYLSHCNSDVPDDEINALTDPTYASKFAGSRPETVAGSELERINAAKGYKNSGGSKRVKDITEINECRSIEARVRGITAQMNGIRSSYPVATFPAPDRKPAPELPITPEPNPKSTGCSTNVTDDKDYIAQMSARCMICLADRAVAQTAKDPSLSAEEKIKRETYGTSTKWMSLLSTIALACGKGNNGTHLNTDIMDQERLTFGHCSNDTYKWNDAEPFSEYDRKLISDWNSGEKWSGKKKWSTNAADIEEDFARIYGIKYETATKMFCNQKRFKKGFLTGKIRALNLDYDPAGDPDESMANRRAQFFKYLDGDKKNGEAMVSPNKKYDSVAADLLSCMKESKETAEKIYSGDGSSCTAVQKLNGQHTSNMSAMIRNVKDGGASVMFLADSCMVSSQIERDPNSNSSLENIGFAYPNDVVAKPNVYSLLYDNKNGAMPILAFDNDQVAKHNVGGRYKICSQTNTLSCNDLGKYSFLYPNSTLCTQAKNDASNTRGKAK